MTLSASMTRDQWLREVAREDVTTSRDRLTMALPGIGTETPDADDVAIVSRIVGYDVRTRAPYGRPNVALLRSQLRRWAVRESCGLRRTDGAA